MKKWHCFTIALITAVVLGATFSGSVVFAKSKTFPTMVSTQYGDIEGFNNTPDTIAWKGIPFAKPPVGEYRWKGPQDPEPWDGVLHALDDCAPCTQLITGADWIRTDTAEGSEDCLYLVPERKISVYRESLAAEVQSLNYCRSNRWGIVVNRILSLFSPKFELPLH